jgi:hypothetical protein
MKKILLIAIGFLMIAGSVWAEDYDKEQAYATCSKYIENQVSNYVGTEVPPDYSYEDLGEYHRLSWNNQYPIVLAEQDGKRKTSAVCEVDKRTGEIKYLAVSSREIIKNYFER